MSMALRYDSDVLQTIEDFLVANSVEKWLILFSLFKFYCCGDVSQNKCLHQLPSAHTYSTPYLHLLDETELMQKVRYTIK